jgi:hypothetical protein
MTGSANTPPDANLAQALTQAGIAAFKVAGTGTSLDGKWVIGAMLIDPDTGAVYKAGGGTGGGAVTVADGADVAEGGVGDAAWDRSAANATLVAILKSLAQSAHTNARRNAGVLHRNGITAIDKVSAVGTITLSGQAGGSLASGTTYYVSAVARNKYGPTGAATVVNTSPGGSNGTLRAAFAAPANMLSTDVYDMFLSTDSGAPKYVATVTETQRAAGCLVTAVRTVGAGGTAGAVDVQVVGTGAQTTATQFANNNAYLPDLITAVNCAGYAKASIKTLLAVTDLGSTTVPALTIVPFLKNQIDGFYDQAAAQIVATLTAVGQSLRQDYVLDVNGATGLVVCFGNIAGQGAAASIVVELS